MKRYCSKVTSECLESGEWRARIANRESRVFLFLCPRGPPGRSDFILTVSTLFVTVAVSAHVTPVSSEGRGSRIKSVTSQIILQF